jgi:hypothetical protein
MSDDEHCHDHTPSIRIWELAHAFLRALLKRLGKLIASSPANVSPDNNRKQPRDHEEELFGVLVVKYIGISLLTPPVGFNIYVVASATNNTIPLQTIFRGCYWFLACEVVIMMLLIAFPQISLFLPNLMG